MATYFRNVLHPGVGTTEVEILNVTTSKATVIGLSLTNLTGNPVLASIRLANTTASAPNNSAYYVKEIVVPPNQSLRVINGGEKLVLASNMIAYVQSNTASSLDVVASYVEIS